MKTIADGSLLFTSKDCKTGILPEIEKHFDMCKEKTDNNSCYRIDWKIIYGKKFGHTE